MSEYQTLVRNCLEGNHAAQKELYDLFAPAMLGVCYRYTKSINDAEDILQDGFIKVFERLHQYKGEGELGGWVRRIMVNTAINFLKRNVKYRNELCFEDTSLHPVSNDNPEITLSAKQIAELIRQLPTGYQTIFNMHAIEGYTHVEIGNMLGIHEGTSRSQYARARALLIEWMQNNFDSKQYSYAGKRI